MYCASAVDVERVAARHVARRDRRRREEDAELLRGAHARRDGRDELRDVRARRRGELLEIELDAVGRRGRDLRDVRRDLRDPRAVGELLRGLRAVEDVAVVGDEARGERDAITELVELIDERVELGLRARVRGPDASIGVRHEAVEHDVLDDELRRGSLERAHLERVERAAIGDDGPAARGDALDVTLRDLMRAREAAARCEHHDEKREHRFLHDPSSHRKETEPPLPQPHW